MTVSEGVRVKGFGEVVAFSLQAMVSGMFWICRSWNPHLSTPEFCILFVALMTHMRQVALKRQQEQKLGFVFSFSPQLFSPQLYEQPWAKWACRLGATLWWQSFDHYKLLPPWVCRQQEPSARFCLLPYAAFTYTGLGWRPSACLLLPAGSANGCAQNLESGQMAKARTWLLLPAGSLCFNCHGYD